MFPYACHGTRWPGQRICRNARLKLGGRIPTQQVFECVDHGQAERDADGAARRHLETRCMLWSVLVVVGDDGDVAVTASSSALRKAPRNASDGSRRYFSIADGDGAQVHFSTVERGGLSMVICAGSRCRYGRIVPQLIAFDSPTDVKRDGLRAPGGQTTPT